MKLLFTFEYLAFCVLLFALSSIPTFGAKIQVSITVDDLPAHGPLSDFGNRLEIAQQMIAVFKKHSVREVYGFVNGKPADENPNDVSVFEAWVKGGHPLGNHTYSHVDASKVSPETFSADWKKNEEILKRFSKNGDYHYFRFPYLNMGETWEKRQEIVKKLELGGYKISEVTLDFSDWAWNEPFDRCVKKKNTKAIKELEDYYLKIALQQLDWSIQASEKTFDRVIPLVLLLHIASFGTKNLDKLLTTYEKRGVEFVSLKKAMSDPAYATQVDVKRNEQGGFFDRYATIRNRTIDPESEEHLEYLTKVCAQ